VKHVENSLLARLPSNDRARLLALCETVPLGTDQVLYRGGEVIRYAYFPLDGFCSVVTLLAGRPVLEVGMVGFEGMLGMPLALGVARTPFHAVVQGPGRARRISAAALRRELGRSAALSALLYRYVHVSIVQLASSATCLGSHSLGPRLARWLLMTQDRARSGAFHVTHEYLAYMLGVRRVGVTQAAKALQRQGFIEYSRGDVRVLDRRGLREAACECYAADRRAYARFAD
jgi:CRP-like cAMP-binding protein